MVVDEVVDALADFVADVAGDFVVDVDWTVGCELEIVEGVLIEPGWAVEDLVIGTPGTDIAASLDVWMEGSGAEVSSRVVTVVMRLWISALEGLATTELADVDAVGREEFSATSLLCKARETTSGVGALLT